MGLLSCRGCQTYHIEESLEFLGIWITLLAVLGQFSDAAPRPRPRVRRILYLFPMFLFIHLLLPTSYLQLDRQLDLLHHTLSTLPLRLEYRFLAQPLAVEYESHVELQGYKIDRGADAVTTTAFYVNRQLARL